MENVTTFSKLSEISSDRRNPRILAELKNARIPAIVTTTGKAFSYWNDLSIEEVFVNPLILADTPQFKGLLQDPGFGDKGYKTFFTRNEESYSFEGYIYSEESSLFASFDDEKYKDCIKKTNGAIVRIEGIISSSEDLFIIAELISRGFHHN
jgi:hypothetical protein